MACGVSQSQQEDRIMKFNELSQEEKNVIIDKGTERPFTGKFNDFKGEGIFTCRQCSQPLFMSETKFDSKSGWPSFDKDINGTVKKITDSDGSRTEIVCERCDGHLGHVFYGEHLTKNNARFCVNSLSLDFVGVEKLDTAIFASGCFWGTEYYFERATGVLFTGVGYIGGEQDKPTYKEVCTGITGHAEATRVVYDKSKTDYETLARLFFETHDPTQVNRQGPDIGTQYRSEVFYKTPEEKELVITLIEKLEKNGYDIATKVTEATTFWSAEDYHQQYYSGKGSTPYCHFYTPRFKD